MGFVILDVVIFPKEVDDLHMKGCEPSHHKYGKRCLYSNNQIEKL